MRIWYATLYEPLPIGGADIRPMRSGLLADAIVNSDHELELWLPGFEHVHHMHYRIKPALEKYKDNYFIQYLAGCGYDSDMSIKRFKHNKQIAKSFTDTSKSRTNKPDLIVTQIPSLELAEAAVDYAIYNNIPVVVDIRDLWPDIYQRLFPRSVNLLYRFIFQREIKRAAHILRNAAAITAVSESFVEWGLNHAGRSRSSLDRIFYIGYPDSEFGHLTKEEINQLEAKYNFTHKEITIFFAGTFCSSYDLDTVFVCAEMLKVMKIHNVHIVIAGGGIGEDQIKQKCADLENTSYVGWLDANELSAFLSLADIGLAPYADGALMSLPNKPFEYMAASLPILNCLKGELESLIVRENCGKMYQAGNANSLLSEILGFVHDTGLIKQLGMNGREAFKRSYESSAIYIGFVQHLEEIVNEFRRTQA